MICEKGGTLTSRFAAATAVADDFEDFCALCFDVSDVSVLRGCCCWRGAFFDRGRCELVQVGVCRVFSSWH